MSRSLTVAVRTAEQRTMVHEKGGVFENVRKAAGELSEVYCILTVSSTRYYSPFPLLLNNPPSQHLVAPRGCSGRAGNNSSFALQISRACG